MNPVHEAIHDMRGLSLLIGKDEQTARLLVTTTVKGRQVKFNLGQPNSVPNCVSRCKPGQNVAHCAISIDNNGNLQVQNMKPQNVTFVNGMQVMQCGISPDVNLQLGCEMFNLNVSQFLLDARRALDKVIERRYSIAHLENVWDGYKESVNKIKKRQKKVGLISRVSMFFTVGSGALAALGDKLGMNDMQQFLWVFPVIGLIVMIVGFILTARDKSIEEIDQLSENLQESYVCPNPACNHFVGNQPYKVLRQNKGCPYCRCAWES